MTAGEFAALPEGPPYFQLVEGELFFMASPTRLHQKIVLRLAYAIETHLRAHPGMGELNVAPSDVKLDEGNVFEPDLYFVSQERAGILTEQGASGAPDLVIEVSSTSTLRLDRGMKRRVYFRAGVRELWLIAPENRRLEVHFPDSDPQAPWRLGAGDVLTTPILPGWSVPVEEIFPEV